MYTNLNITRKKNENNFTDIVSAATILKTKL